LRFEPRDLAVTHNERDGSGDPLVVNRALNFSSNALQSLRRERDRFRLGRGKFLSKRRQNGQKQENQCLNVNGKSNAEHESSQNIPFDRRRFITAIHHD
jgi:hypothetical protein